MPTTRRFAAVALSVAGLGACAGAYATTASSVALAPPARATPDRVLAASASAWFPPENIRWALPAGTVLVYRGSLPQGEVWRPSDREITVQIGPGRAQEGWVVLSGQAWVGVFLPVARTFVPLRRPVPFVTERRA